MKRRPALVLVAGVAGVLVACQLVVGIDHVEKVQVGVSEAGDVRDAGAGAGPGDPCAHDRPPPMPEHDDDHGMELPPLYLAVRSLDLIAKAGGVYRGFDLDGVCTCDDRPGAAFGGESSCTPKVRQCDGDGGVDNRSGALVEKFTPTGYSPTDLANERIAAGQRGLMLYIQSYNGKRNDQHVKVGVMISDGILDGSGCGTSTGELYSPPGWCGDDLWTFPARFVKPSTKEPLFQADGYVNDGTLVFRSDEETTVLFGGAALLFGSPVMAGRIEQSQDGRWMLTGGLLAGRVPVTALLTAIGTIDDDPDGGGFCSSVPFGTVKKELCNAVDISKSNAFDFKAYVCDGISTTIAFEAEQARVGESYTASSASQCAIGNVAPDLYSCP